MLCFGRIRLARPQLYTNIHAQKQRQEVEDSLHSLFLFFLLCMKYIYTKNDKMICVINPVMICSVVILY